MTVGISLIDFELLSVVVIVHVAVAVHMTLSVGMRLMSFELTSVNRCAVDFKLVSGGLRTVSFKLMIGGMCVGGDSMILMANRFLNGIGLSVHSDIIVRVCLEEHLRRDSCIHVVTDHALVSR